MTGTPNGAGRPRWSAPRPGRHLVLRTPAGRPTAAFSTRASLVDLHPAYEPAIGFDQPHVLQDLVFKQLHGAVAHAQVSLKLQNRDVDLRPRRQLHREEPTGQPQLG